MKHFIISVTLIFACISINAQEFDKFAEFTAGKTDAFYKIKLTPEIKSSLKTSLGDIRIYDQENNEIPYLILPEREFNYSKTVSPTIELVKTETTKRSVYKISLPSPQYFSKLEFEITNKNMFLRKAFLATTKNAKTTLADKDDFRQFTSFSLSSKNKNSVAFHQQKLKVFYLVIINNDDAPITVNAVNIFQEDTYLTSDLKANGVYMLRFGNSDLKPPVYDLRYFTDNIPSQLDIIEPGSTTLNSVIVEKEEVIEEEENSTSPYIWIMLSVAILALAFFSIKMLNDKKKE